MGKLEGASGMVLKGDGNACGLTFKNGDKISLPSGRTFNYEEDTYSSPDAVYRATRNPKWLKMPEPEDNEIYMLMHISDSSELIAFYMTGCDCTVETGTSVDGVFVADEGSAQTVTNGVRYENEIMYQDAYSELDDGTRQIMIRINGSGNITNFYIDAHSKGSTLSFMSWKVVEWWGRLPRCQKIYLSDSSNPYKRLHSLRYIRVAGPNRITKVTELCNGLPNIIAILELDTSAALGMAFDYFCKDCPKLLAMPVIKLVSTVVFSYAFYNSGLHKIEVQNSEKITRAYNKTFQSCASLEELDIDTSNISRAFELSGLTSLKRFHMDTTSMTEGVVFSELYSLAELIFSTENKVPSSIQIIRCALSYDALLDTLASIPEAQAARTLTLTGTRGAKELTEDDIAAMTAKNWTVVI
ncbi:MAG: hypothetical protein IJT38_05690 [Clostridia bacterium]|nr:hypothetical protein [Clostridia bacterium]